MGNVIKQMSTYFFVDWVEGVEIRIHYMIS